MRNIIIVTGGAGFIGSNLIELLIKKTSYQIISLDNYSTGSKKNHIVNKKVSYLRGSTKNFDKIFKKKSNKIKTIFHFAEFSRIYQSFFYMKDCIDSNILGTSKVIQFCLDNKIKIIYSATSASLGNNQQDQHLSPYSYSKSFNLNLIINLHNWHKLKYEIIYFYNVYGPRQITKSHMSALIGIFQDQYINKKSLTVVLPGSQTRKFTHVKDTVRACYLAFKKNKNTHYSVMSKKSYTILNIAKFFSDKIRYIPIQQGERFKSGVIKQIRGNKINTIISKIDIKDYIKNFKSLHQKKLIK
jgi:UDP-glucose 4-epimerase